MASNLNSGSGGGENPRKPPSLGYVLRITWMFHMANSLLSSDETFTKVEKQLEKLSDDPETKTVAIFALLGMGMFDKNTFDLYKELQG